MHFNKKLKKNEKKIIEKNHMLVPKRLVLTTWLNIEKAQYTWAYKLRPVHLASFILMFIGERLFFLKK